jgi:hypothetical protein
VRYNLLLFVCVAIGGCSSGSDTIVNEPSALAFRRPGVGTSIVSKTWELDQAGNKFREEGTRTVDVVASGISYYGKNNIAQFQEEFNMNDFVNYDSNGNISLLGLGDSGSNYWAELPVATRGTRSYVSGKNTKREITFTHAGRELVNLAHHEFNTVKIVMTHRYWEEGSSDTTIDQPATFWYAPELGWYVKYEYSDAGSHYRMELQSYTLR